MINCGITKNIANHSSRHLKLKTPSRMWLNIFHPSLKWDKFEKKPFREFCDRPIWHWQAQPPDSSGQIGYIKWYANFTLLFSFYYPEPENKTGFPTLGQMLLQDPQNERARQIQAETEGRELDDSVLGWRELVGSRLERSMAAPSLMQFHMVKWIP